MSVKRKDIENVVARTLKRMIGSKDVKVSLANLRRGASRHPGEMPQLWSEFLEYMSEEMYGRSGQISDAEWAVYMALTLYAVHQQGNDVETEPMYRHDEKNNTYNFGSAVANLIKSEDDFKRILRRMNAVLTSSSVLELRRHLLSLVQLLRAEKISLDYARLAGDIYIYQNADWRKSVCLQWGRDFHGTYYRNNGEAKENGQDKRD